MALPLPLPVFKAFKRVEQAVEDNEAAWDDFLEAALVGIKFALPQTTELTGLGLDEPRLPSDDWQYGITALNRDKFIEELYSITSAVVVGALPSLRQGIESIEWLLRSQGYDTEREYYNWFDRLVSGVIEIFTGILRGLGIFIGIPR